MALRKLASNWGGALMLGLCVAGYVPAAIAQEKPAAAVQNQVGPEQVASARLLPEATPEDKAKARAEVAAEA